MHRYVRTAEVVAVALIAAALTATAMQPRVLPNVVASRPDMVVLPVIQTPAPPPVFNTPVKCTHGKPSNAWGVWLVPADTECFETAKVVGIVFRGPVKEYIEKDFDRVVAEAGARPIKFFRITSPGGSDTAGRHMGRWLYAHKGVEVIVAGWCASACSSAVLGAGKGRIAIVNGGKIGVHQARSDETGQPLVAYSIRTAEELGKLGLPPSVVFAAGHVPPDSIYTLTSEELAAYGVRTT